MERQYFLLIMDAAGFEMFKRFKVLDKALMFLMKRNNISLEKLAEFRYLEQVFLFFTY